MFYNCYVFYTYCIADALYVILHNIVFSTRRPPSEFLGLYYRLPAAVQCDNRFGTIGTPGGVALLDFGAQLGRSPLWVMGG